MLTSILRIPSLTCCCKRLYVVCHIPSFVCWPPCPSGRFVLSGHLLSHNQRYGDRKVLALKQSLLRRLSFQKVLHQPAVQGCPAKPSSLSQPPSNPFRNPTAARLYGSLYYCQRTSFRLTRHLPTHILSNGVW
jgi:hypothetical protein